MNKKKGRNLLLAFVMAAVLAAQITPSAALAAISEIPQTQELSPTDQEDVSSGNTWEISVEDHYTGYDSAEVPAEDILANADDTGENPEDISGEDTGASLSEAPADSATEYPAEESPETEEWSGGDSTDISEDSGEAEEKCTEESMDAADLSGEDSADNSEDSAEIPTENSTEAAEGSAETTEKSGVEPAETRENPGWKPEKSLSRRSPQRMMRSRRKIPQMQRLNIR